MQVSIKSDISNRNNSNNNDNIYDGNNKQQTR